MDHLFYLRAIAKLNRNLYLYVLPARTAAEAGGFGRAATRRRSVAVSVTFGSGNEFQQWHSADCGKLVEHLRKASCVVGYNLDFDYGLLRSEVAFRRPKTFDLHQQFTEVVGRNVSLAETARAAFGRVGFADGNSLTEAWREGARERVVRALRRKLNVIRRLHEHIIAHGWFAVMENGKSARYTLRQDRNDAADSARRAMLDKAADAFAATGRIPCLVAVQNPGSGRARVVGGGPDCENGMARQVGHTGC